MEYGMDTKKMCRERPEWKADEAERPKCKHQGKPPQKGKMPFI